MTVERQPVTKVYSPSELGFQRLLIRDLKDQSRPGEGLKRFGLNAAIFTGSTAVDLAESHAVDKFIRNRFNKIKTQHEDVKDLDSMRDLPEKTQDQAWYKTMEDKLQKQHEGAAVIVQLEDVKKHVKEAAENEQGKKWAAEFLEEWWTDSLQGGIANAWVRLMTGMEDAHYVSPTSEVITDGFVTWSQVFNKNAVYPKRFREGGKVDEPRRGWKGIKLAYEAADFVNPVNVEAAFRMIEEIPVVGDGVAWLRKKSDHYLETKVGSIAKSAAFKGVLGFHIGKNIKPL